MGLADRDYMRLDEPARRRMAALPAGGRSSVFSRAAQAAGKTLTWAVFTVLLVLATLLLALAVSWATPMPWVSGLLAAAGFLIVLACSSVSVLGGPALLLGIGLCFVCGYCAIMGSLGHDVAAVFAAHHHDGPHPPRVAVILYEGLVEITPAWVLAAFAGFGVMVMVASRLLRGHFGLRALGFVVLMWSVWYAVAKTGLLPFPDHG